MPAATQMRGLTGETETAPSLTEPAGASTVTFGAAAHAVAVQRMRRASVERELRTRYSGMKSGCGS